MKLHDFQLQTFSKWITFIPTIEVHIDNPIDDSVTFYEDWWNAPYQKGGKE